MSIHHVFGLPKNRKSFSKKGPERRELSIVWPIIIVVFHPWVSNRMKMVDAVFLACDANQVSHPEHHNEQHTHTHTHTSHRQTPFLTRECTRDNTLSSHTYRQAAICSVLDIELQPQRVLGRTLNCSRNPSWVEGEQTAAMNWRSPRANRALRCRLQSQSCP